MNRRGFAKDSLRLTKNDLARVIVQVLRKMDDLPAADHFQVKQIERAPKIELERRHEQAMKILIKASQ